VGLAVERPIAAENVAEVAAVDDREDAIDQVVPEAIECGHRPGTHFREPIADDVIVVPGEDGFDQIVGVSRSVRSVSIDHEHDRPLDVLQGLPDRLSFPGSRLLDNRRSLLTGNSDRFVTGATVDNQAVFVPLLLETREDVTDSGRLIERRDQHAHVRALHRPPVGVGRGKTFAWNGTSV
jgi:hypothetical protein